MQSYMKRVESENRSLWKTLTSVESDAIFNHIKDNDLSETVQDWQDMALEQGFSRTEVMFVNPTNYLAMFCFYP